MRKAHLKTSGETRTELIRGRLSPTELAQVRAAQKDGGYESVSDLLMAGIEALPLVGRAEELEEFLHDLVAVEMEEWSSVQHPHLPSRLWGWGSLRDFLNSA